MNDAQIQNLATDYVLDILDKDIRVTDVIAFLDDYYIDNDIDIEFEELRGIATKIASHAEEVLYELRSQL